MRVTILPKAIILTEAGRIKVSMMAKVCIFMLLIFTTKLDACLCNYNATVVIC